MRCSCSNWFVRRSRAGRVTQEGVHRSQSLRLFPRQTLRSERSPGRSRNEGGGAAGWRGESTYRKWRGDRDAGRAPERVAIARTQAGRERRLAQDEGPGTTVSRVPRSIRRARPWVIQEKNDAGERFSVEPGEGSWRWSGGRGSSADGSGCGPDLVLGWAGADLAVHDLARSPTARTSQRRPSDGGTDVSEGPLSLRRARGPGAVIRARPGPCTPTLRPTRNGPGHAKLDDAARGTDDEVVDPPQRDGLSPGLGFWG